MPKPKKGDPELLLVSFCDIVTITTAALFMAMVVVIDMAAKTPILRPTPIAFATTNAPVYFECRNNQLFYIDRSNLLARLDADAATLDKISGTPEQALRALLRRELGDAFYRVDTRYLMFGEVALRPQTNSPPGLNLEELGGRTNRFMELLGRLNHSNQYVVFLVRDDSFPVFRRVRDLSVINGYPSGWEFLTREEPITFDGLFSRVKTQ